MRYSAEPPTQRTRFGHLLFVLFVVGLTACFDSGASVCTLGASEWYCPGDMACHPSVQCVTMEQVQACADNGDRAGCSTTLITAGRCVHGACLPAMCGDGVKDEGEECDDGLNNSDSLPDACRDGCHRASCGDGVVDTGEECDDASGLSDTLTDACRRTCVLPACGDDVVDTGEACDDGPDNSDIQPNACREDCRAPRCGDGVQDSGEECDEGAANADLVPDACRTSCSNPGCGDGVQDGGEECDDGNALSGDGCRSDCRKVETCGDGVQDEREACDDGNSNPADGCDACVINEWRAAAEVGENSADARAIEIGPQDVATDRSGNYFVADRANHRILRVDGTTGVITTIAGIGTEGYSGDGGAATSAQLRQPTSVAVDGLGNLFIADLINHRVRRVDAATGVITTVAGTGVAGSSGDGGDAANAQLDWPEGVAVDGLGNLFISESHGHRIRWVEPGSGIITTLVGTGVAGFSGDGGSAASAQISWPIGIALDDNGNLYIADTLNYRIRRVSLATGIITTVAGSGVSGFSGDGGDALIAQLNEPSGLTVDGLGNLFIADNLNHRLRRVDAASGVITTVAGSGPIGYNQGGYSGDQGPATSARLHEPAAVTVDDLGNLLIADSRNNCIRRVEAGTRIITTVAGSGAYQQSGDGGFATSAKLPYLSGFAVDGLGNLYAAELFNHRVRRVDKATGVITTIAGTGTSGFAGDGGAATSAQLNEPYGLTVDGLGNLVIADYANNRVRRVDAVTGVITTVAGNGTWGYTGDGGDAVNAQLNRPTHVASDALGNLWITDYNNHCIRRVDATTGAITTVAGTGAAGDTGDGGAATSAQLNEPQGVFVDGIGNLFIADRGNHRVRRVDAVTGVITTVAGTGVPDYSGDGGSATIAQLEQPRDVAVDGLGNLWIADSGNCRVRRVGAVTGVIDTIAGSGISGPACGGSSGDAGQATAASLSVDSIVLDGLGVLYVEDGINDRIRRIDLTSGVITTAAGQIAPAGMGPVDQATLADPRALVLSTPFALVAGGATGTVQASWDTGWVDVVAGRYPQDPATDDLARYRDESFGEVHGIAYDATTQRIYLSETSANRLHVVTIVDPDDVDTWTIAALANTAGVADFADGPVLTARFQQPAGLHLDETSQTLYVADARNHVVRAIDLSGGATAATVTTVAGTPGTLGFFGDGGDATSALLYQPQAITLCDNGDLFIADTDNHRIRRVEAVTGTITTVLGDGVAASSGQGTPSDTFPVNAPLGLACDSIGNLYVTSTTTVRLVLADDNGVVDGTGDVQTIFGAPPRDTFPASVATCLTGIALVDDETVQVVDSCAGVLVELSRVPVP